MTATWRCWRTGADVLVELGASTFVMLDASGGVLGRFSRNSFSSEDDLWTIEFEVVANRLLERTTIDGRHGTEQREEVVRDELHRAHDDAARVFVDHALARDRLARLEAAARTEREADARVVALGAPIDDALLAPDEARAQAALIQRVRAYDDTLAADLLRTMIALVTGGASGAPHAVRVLYARACLIAAFAAPATEPADHHARLDAGNLDGALAVEIARRAAELDARGDGQELADAMNNARAYWVAARTLRRLLPRGG